MPWARTLHVACMLRAACCVLHVACGVLHVACCTLRVARYNAQVIVLPAGLRPVKDVLFVCARPPALPRGPERPSALVRLFVFVCLFVCCLLVRGSAPAPAP